MNYREFNKAHQTQNWGGGKSVCWTGKSMYPTKEVAIVYANRYQTDKIKLYVYECRLCRGFHLTKQKQETK